MSFFSILPAALVALVLASPVLAASSSPNEPFRAISVHAIRQPEPPVCRLTPLPPVEPVEQDVLLSFEEWKEKRASMQASKDKPPTSSPSANLDAGRETVLPVPDNISLSQELPDTTSDSDSATEKVSPHFQVPLTDRFNYASMDCSARVHLAHRSAKSPSSILSSKRDRYMLSPCSSPKENQFVVVELCEDIRIDTVQLANFEFFSGVFKDFTVSVAKTYKDDWVFAGTYKAKNIRGVQSFHPPTSLSDFYRFIRIDFHTHYSNEFYCPISLLRVYGLTHLEEWKWDIWTTESKAKREELAESSSSMDEISLPIQTLEPVDPEDSSISSDSFSVTSASSLTTPIGSISQATLMPFAWEQLTTATANDETLPATKTHDIHDTDLSTTAPSASPTALLPLSANTSATADTLNTTVVHTTSSSTIVSVTTQVYSPPHVPGGESIYRIIMNRLTAVEANQTLYVRYVEEQTNSIRELIRRLGEDLGRLEGIGKAQAQSFERSLKEWESQRKLLETEYSELVARVEHLSDEIVVEKRIGIAQLCLLLAVIVFMGLTRGSRGESLVEHGHLRMRDWSRRHLSFSGDWVNRFTSSSSRSRSRSRLPGNVETPKQSSAAPQVRRDDEHKLAFPMLSARPRAPKSASHAKPHVTMSERKPKTSNIYAPSSSRSHTPSLRSSHPHNPRLVSRPTTPITTTFRPQIQRANSLTHSGLPTSASWMGVVGPVPKSAKRWAKTAHLHEVKSPMISAGWNKTATNMEGPQEGKERLRIVVPGPSDSMATFAESNSNDELKSLGDDMIIDGNGNGFPETPRRSSRRANGNAHIMISDTALSSNGLQKRLPLSPGSSYDGEDGDLWVDTDATDPSVDGDDGFGFGYD